MQHPVELLQPKRSGAGRRDKRAPERAGNLAGGQLVWLAHGIRRPKQERASMMAGYSSPSRVSERSRPPHPIAKQLAGAAGALGALGITNHFLARRAERLHPPMGRFISVEGVRLHYLDQGAGPVVVLLNGNGTMAWDFVLSGLVASLETDHRVIAFDRPGFGYSERPRSRVWTPQDQAVLLGQALRILDARPAIIVGHSWGTLVAISMALRDPEGATGLVLLSGYYYPTFRKDSASMS